MTLETWLSEKKMSIYQCARESGVPYTTLSELVRGKTRMENCSAHTVYKLAKALDTTMEELLESCAGDRTDISCRSSFETFKSNVCHLVKDSGDIDFIIDTLQSDKIRKYWIKEWYQESFYLLAMIDYLSRENQLPICTDYDDIRCCSLPEPLYPRDISLAAKLSPDLDVKKESLSEAIPEFVRFNIVESRVRDVC